MGTAVELPTSLRHGCARYAYRLDPPVTYDSGDETETTEYIVISRNLRTGEMMAFPGIYSRDVVFLARDMTEIASVRDASGPRELLGPMGYDTIIALPAPSEH